MLKRIMQDERPALIAVVMDAPGRTFRDELFAEYKANRPPMPDDMRQQINPLLEAIESLGLPLLRIEGVEADDVIGTLAVQAAGAGIDTVIATGDKDMAQLVNKHITLLDTMPRGPGNQPRPMDAAGVVEKFQVKPTQIYRLPRARGRQLRQYPGRAESGPETAVELLKEYAGVDDILAKIDNIPELPIRGAKAWQNESRQTAMRCCSRTNSQRSIAHWTSTANPRNSWQRPLIRIDCARSTNATSCARY